MEVDVLDKVESATMTSEPPNLEWILHQVQTDALGEKVTQDATVLRLCWDHRVVFIH